LKAGFENPIVDIRAKGTLVPCKDIVSFENLEIGHTYSVVVVDGSSGKQIVCARSERSVCEATILVLCTSAVGIGMGLIGRKRSHKQK